MSLRSAETCPCSAVWTVSQAAPPPTAPRSAERWERPPRDARADRKQRALLRARRGEIAATVDDPERTEDLELHLHRIVARVTSGLAAHNPRVSRLLDRDRRRWPYSSTTAPTGGSSSAPGAGCGWTPTEHDLGQNSWLTRDEWRRRTRLARAAAQARPCWTWPAARAARTSTSLARQALTSSASTSTHTRSRRPTSARGERASPQRHASSTPTQGGHSRSRRQRSTPWSASTPSTTWPTGRRCCGSGIACSSRAATSCSPTRSSSPASSPAKRSHSERRSASSSSRCATRTSGWCEKPVSTSFAARTAPRTSPGWRGAGATLAPDTGTP